MLQSQIKITDSIPVYLRTIPNHSSVQSLFSILLFSAGNHLWIKTVHLWQLQQSQLPHYLQDHLSYLVPAKVFHPQSENDVVLMYKCQLAKIQILLHTFPVPDAYLCKYPAPFWKVRPYVFHTHACILPVYLFPDTLVHN